jgi:hypothetical protein
VRTTIEIKNTFLAELLKRAAHQSKKGISHIIEEALETYFERKEVSIKTREKALRLKGCLGRKYAEQLRRESEKVRGNWR